MSTAVKRLAACRYCGGALTRNQLQVCSRRECQLRRHRESNRKSQALTRVRGLGADGSGWETRRSGRSLRLCLNCDRPFASEGKFNRLCPRCRARAAELGDE